MGGREDGTSRAKKFSNLVGEFDRGRQISEKLGRW